MSIIVNAYSTLTQLPPPSLFPHTLIARRDLTDPELRSHLDGFRGYVWSKANGTMTQTTYHVLRHIERVCHQLSFEVDESRLALVEPWAWEANAIVFLPDGTVRDPAGRILVDAGGRDPDPAARLPFPADAVERKQRTDLLLRQMSIYVPPSIPPVIGVGEVLLRPAADVARRALALFVASLRAESISINKPIEAPELVAAWPIAFGAQSAAESAFMAADNPPQQDILNFVWRYEALALLEWALGIVDELPFPTAICDVPKVARAAIDHNSSDFVETAKLRPASLILDALDLHYRLHWAVRQARVDKRHMPASLEPGVVSERHHALNWLVTFENADWDDVDTPT